MFAPRIVLVAVWIPSVACGGASPGSDATTMSEPATTLGPGSSSDAPADLGSTLSLDVGIPKADLGDIDACACAPVTDDIVVVTFDGEVATFDPSTTTFETVIPSLGALPGCGNSLYSMSLDRAGRAWLQFDDGTLARVSLADPDACELVEVDTSAVEIDSFGMGFVSTGADDPCELLFGHRNPFGGAAPGELFAIDPVTLHADDVGASAYAAAELTGTGDGRLFAMGRDPGGVVELADIDPGTGVVLATTPLDDLDLQGGFAFATWGGDVWFFTASDEHPGRSEVNMLDADDSDGNGVQDLTEVVATVPLGDVIVGAGVSTCAPIGPAG